MNKKILIVDDDMDLLTAMKILLKNSGYQVATVAEAEKAIPHMREFKPDLVVLDIMLADADGRDICRLIKGDQELKDTPVIMLSAHQDANQSSLAVGANEFIAKPFDVSLLKAAIRRQLA